MECFFLKSHSCGSRLEIAGTEEERHETLRGESIAEEVVEAREHTEHTLDKTGELTEHRVDKSAEEENHTSLEEEEDKAEADR